MGTEVLLPHDILGSRGLGFGPAGAEAAGFFHRRKQATPSSGPGANPRPRRRTEPRKRREGSPRPGAAAPVVAGKGNGMGGGLVMGQVTILRRGESLDSVAGRGRAEERGKRGDEGEVLAAASPVVLSSEAGGDLIVFGTGRLGPEPAAVPTRTRLVGVRTRQARAGAGAEALYAGPAFSLSPSPRALPLPTFSSRKPGEGEGEGGGDGVHLSATMDLRRILRLD